VVVLDVSLLQEELGIGTMRARDQDRAQLRKEFRRRKTIRLGIFFIALALMIGVTLLAFPSWVLFGLPKGVWAPFFYLAMFALIGSIALIWRCPACHALLGDVFSTRYCSKCGICFEGDASSVDTEHASSNENAQQGTSVGTGASSPGPR
jgi:hypothetical protein